MTEELLIVTDYKFAPYKIPKTIPNDIFWELRASYSDWWSQWECESLQILVEWTSSVLQFIIYPCEDLTELLPASIILSSIL